MSESDIFCLVLVACSFTTVASQCSEIRLQDTHTKLIDGGYSLVSYSATCSRRNTYIHEGGFYYMYYEKRGDYWYVGDDACGDGAGKQYARVQSDEEYPENIEEDWEEKDESGHWEENDDVEVHCGYETPPSSAEEDGLSPWGIFGIVMVSVSSTTLIIVLIVFLCKRQKRKEALRSQAQVAHENDMRNASTSHVGADQPPAYTNPNYDLTMNGTGTGLSLHANDLHFDIPPPSYEEIANKGPISMDPYVNASAPHPEANERKKQEV